MEYYYQLEIWKGNINGVLRVARQREELNDWLVAMAPMASFDTWSAVCEDYAVQLETDGQYHKAASYFLACHKVYEAIKLLKRHKLFKEAIALAKVRLSPLDPALEELYTLWAQQLTKDGNYEQAAKCHLAMKQVQDAAKLLARRYDQSSLKAAAHISLVANDRQQGLVYTQRAVQTHLLQHEWADTYAYLREQKGSQVFLAISSTHEMLFRELSHLGLLAVDTDKFTQWGQTTTSTKRVMLPDFILDPEDVDPMSPWQPHLVEGHTFPHHILRTWYSHFDIPIDTASLEDMYKTLCLLHAGRQTQVDLQQVLIHICMDLTLCVLSLMMSETPTAMSHLLQAVGGLHEAGRLDVMQGLLQLFLPQGPKYMLKLQQEVTALRVLISMDTHTHVDGASKVHTIKRYLSDFKDEGAVNTSSLRCRELDCLRAYYYMVILNFLKERCTAGEATLADDGSGQALDGSGKIADVDVTKDGSCGEETGVNDAGNAKSLVSGHVTSTTKLEDDVRASESTATVISDGESGLDDRKGRTDLQNMSVSSSTDVNQTVLKSVDRPKADNDLSVCSIVKEEDSEMCSDQNKASDEKPNSDSVTPNPVLDELEKENSVTGKELEGKDSKPKAELSEQTLPTVAKATNDQIHSSNKITMPNTMPTINLNHFSITISKLLHISQGLLWDLQAKRYALTETLGYIHKAISQLLLSKNPKPSESSDLVAVDISIQNDLLSSYNQRAPTTDSNNEHLTRSTSSPGDTNPSNEDKHSDGAVGMATGGSSENKVPENLARSISAPCGHEHEHIHHGHLCHSQLSHHFDHMVHLHTEHLSEIAMTTGDNQGGASDFNSSLFDICASCDMLHKSRKILWEDEPQFLHRTDSSLKDLMSITNPAKYINVPDEWYGMPMDEKYFRPYVTMAILKEEQEYVMHELKRGPDSTQSPFPNPLESVRALVEVSQHSSHISTVERRQFVQKVTSWALNFAVTSQQKQQFVNLLQSELQG